MKFTISDRMGALNTAGKVTFFPGDAVFGVHQYQCTSTCHGGERRRHTPLDLVAPTGKASLNIFIVGLMKSEQLWKNLVGKGYELKVVN